MLLSTRAVWVDEITLCAFALYPKQFRPGLLFGSSLRVGTTRVFLYLSYVEDHTEVPHSSSLLPDVFIEAKGEQAKYSQSTRVQNANCML